MRIPSRFRSLLAAAAFVAVAGAATTAAAKPNIDRKGGQWGVWLGGSACVPGKAKCARDNIMDGGITVDGKTRPSFGMGAELGYRFNKWVFAGAAYDLGFFDTNYEIGGVNAVGYDGYKRAYQNSVFGVVRPTLAVWRLDIGLGLAPGFSRLAFVRSNGDKDYSQGFAFKFSPVVDIFITKRIFLGAKVDLILNAHTKSCEKVGDDTHCVDTRSHDLAPVHQVIFGLHIGGTFL